jgi:hypothetical protein
MGHIMNFKKNNLKGNRELIIFILLLYILIVYFLIPLRYEENDDLGMLLITSGDFYFLNPSFLLFSNTFYGKLISTLYSVPYRIEWYTSVAVSLQIVSFLFLFYIFLRRGKLPTLARIAFLVILMAFHWYCIHFFQFTTNAATIGLTGVLVIQYFSNRLIQLIGICLLIVSSMIRFEVFSLILLIYSPFLIWTLKENKNVFYKIMFVIFMGVSFWILDNKILHRDAYLRYYSTKNSSIVDNPCSVKLKDLSENIDMNRYLLFKSFITDESILDDTEKKAIINVLGKISFQEKMNSLKRNLFQYRWVLVSFLIFSALIFSGLTKNKKILLIFSILISFFLMISIHYVGLTLKKRVLVVILFTLFILLFQFQRVKKSTLNQLSLITISTCYLSVFIGKSLLRDSYNWFIILLFSVLLFLFIRKKNYFKPWLVIALITMQSYSAINIVDRLRWLSANENETRIQFIKNEVQLMKKYQAQNGKMIFLHPTDFNMIDSPPFSTSKELHSIKFVCSGWLRFVLREKRYMLNFRESILNTGFLVKKNNEKFIKLTEMYYKKNFQSEIRPIIKMESETHRIVEFVRMYKTKNLR